MKTKQTYKRYDGREKCRAVLQVWSEKWTGVRVCKEMGIAPWMLRQWQDEAMEGMLLALAPREGKELEEKGPEMAPKLRRLLEKKAEAQEGKLPRLSRRLAALAAPASGEVK